VRGVKVSRAARKLDVVLVAARYDEERSQLRVAQGYERRGFVWGDLVLFTRHDLLERLKAKKRVVIGVPATLPGDFITKGTVRLIEEGGGAYIIVNGRPTKGDDLGLPLF
jgi:hypothetical protein